jgi:hypothetical protein
LFVNPGGTATPQSNRLIILTHGVPVNFPFEIIIVVVGKVAIVVDAA